MESLDTLSKVVSNNARQRPEGVAFYCADQQMSWLAYDLMSSRLAGMLMQTGLVRGDRVGILLPDGIDLHITMLALQKAGLVGMGIGPRAGRREITHLLGVSGASGLISLSMHNRNPVKSLYSNFKQAGIELSHHIMLDDGLVSGVVTLDGDKVALHKFDSDLRLKVNATALGAKELFFLNSTSGTTGMPKCVAHNQQRWIRYHDLVLDTAPLNQQDVFLSAISGTFGFGLWTSHFTPTILGCPTVILPKFSADGLIEAIERHQVTVLSAVSTQFIMMLNSPLLGSIEIESERVNSLRYLYTGGEAVPYARAAEFEKTTGAYVLQFYGSNETGALSSTTVNDPREKRLTTAGKIINSSNVRLVNENGEDVTSTGEGQPACKSIVNSLGYYNNAKAQKALYTTDGWMLTGDIAKLDDEGYLAIIGRTADFIIRGGKNISGPAVEQAVSGHHDVQLATAVAMPDPVFGEKVCVYACIKPGSELSLGELNQYLDEQGYSREYFPERLIILEQLPMASGGKVAKHLLREDIKQRIATES